MKNLLFKKFLKKTFQFSTYVFIICLFTFIYSLLIYNDLIKSNFNTFNYIVGVVVFFLIGLISGLGAKKNNLFEGFLSGVIVVLLTLCLNFIFKLNLDKLDLIKYVVYILSSILGSLVSIKKRKKE